jgi:CRP-like cAMP-binding protein
MIDFELSYSVADVGVVDLAQNELFDRIYRAAAAAGARFSPRLAGPLDVAAPEDRRVLGSAERLLAGISLFSTLTAEEKAALASQMQRKEYKSGDVVVEIGTILQSLYVVSRGVLAGTVEENGRKIEVIRLGRGDFFGENGLLTGEPLNGEIAALTKVVLYEISKDALSPLLQARPSMAEDLSESLASRRLARRTVLGHHHDQEQQGERLADRVATNIKRLFALR